MNPSKFFNKPSTKPMCIFPQIQPVSRDDGKKYVFTVLNNFASGKFTQEDALLIFKYFMENTKRKLDEDWISFRIEIGKKNTIITPMDLIMPSLKKYSGEQIYDTYAALEHVNLYQTACWLTVLYAFPFRYGQCDFDYQKDFLSKMMDKLLNVCHKLGMPLGFEKSNNTSLTSKLESARSWYYHQNYCIAIAAIDMFLNKYERDKLSKMRFATLTAMHRDCNALKLYNWFLEFVKMEPNEAKSYLIVVDRVKEEFNAMMAEDYEAIEPYSYTPYGKSFQFFFISPYSSKKNPFFHSYINIIGCCAGDENFLMSSFFDSRSFYYVLDIALLVAWRLTETKEQKHEKMKQMLKALVSQNKIQEDEKTLIEKELTEIKSASPDKLIYIYGIKYKSSCPPAIKKFYMTEFSEYAKTNRKCMANNLRSLAIEFLNFESKI